jgi:putative PIN family toxin of toxin-antitoxin system
MLSRKIIVDTNVMVSAFTSANGASREVLRQLLSGQVRALISVALYSEYCDVLGREDFLNRCPLKPAEIQELFEAFLSTTEPVELYFSWRPNLRDEGDNHVYELAIAALDAPLLTYNQRDFMHAQLKFPSLQIMSPSQWLQLPRP